MRIRRWKLLTLPALVFVLILAPAAAKKNSPAPNYERWNDKWFATCQGESFIVDVRVDNPKSSGAHSFHATFLPNSGVCSIGADAPQERVVFLAGTMTNGKISGTIFLCTQSQELVNANGLNAVFSRHFDASYSAEDANITDTNFKGEHYKRYDADTDSSRTPESSASSSKGSYQRDEPGDPEGAFEMHLYRGPAYDQVTHHETNPQRGPTPSQASQARQKLQDVVHDGVHDWLNEFRKMLGADPI